MKSFLLQLNRIRWFKTKRKKIFYEENAKIYLKFASETTSFYHVADEKMNKDQATERDRSEWRNVRLSRKDQGWLEQPCCMNKAFNVFDSVFIEFDIELTFCNRHYFMH